MKSADIRTSFLEYFKSKGHSIVASSPLVPINDPTHARMAISGATRSERAGNISASEAARIKAKARKKLGK